MRICVPPGTWVLANPDQAAQDFAITFQHCYHDLYWCFQNTGLQGNLAVELAINWDTSSLPLRKKWEAIQQTVMEAMTTFQGKAGYWNS